MVHRSIYSQTVRDNPAYSGLLCEIAAEPNPAAFAEFPLKASLKADERNLFMNIVFTEAC